MPQENPQIFISYRRKGGDDFSVRLRDRLSAMGYRVFLDINGLHEGNFEKQLMDRIAECTDVLSILTPGCLDRCHDPEDFVYKELNRALTLKKNVIPVIKNEFHCPENLPEGIRDLPIQNGVNVFHEYFDEAVEHIRKLLQSVPEGERATIDQLRQQIADGNTAAKNELALRLEQEETIPGLQGESPCAEALRLYQQAAAEGDLAALFNLGDLYEGCVRDLTRILDYHLPLPPELSEPAAVEAWLKAQAESCYRKAAEAGFAPAMYRVGNLLEQGEAKDTEAAFQWYRKAAEKEFAPAEHAVGYYYQEGLAPEAAPVDPKEARQWYMRSVQQDYLPALYHLAMLELNQDTAEAERLLRAAAAGADGLPQAACQLGEIYLDRSQNAAVSKEDRSADENLQLAVRFFRQSYEQGFTPAGYGLENCRRLILERGRTWAQTGD